MRRVRTVSEVTSCNPVRNMFWDRRDLRINFKCQLNWIQDTLIAGKALFLDLFVRAFLEEDWHLNQWTDLEGPSSGLSCFISLNVLPAVSWFEGLALSHTTSFLSLDHWRLFGGLPRLHNYLKHISSNPFILCSAPLKNPGHSMCSRVGMGFTHRT